MFNKIKWAIALCLYLTSCSAQDTIKAELVVALSDCRDKLIYPRLDEVIVLKDGETFDTLDVDHKPVTTLKDLESGTYSLVYTSLFGKQEQTDVIIAESKKYKADLCVNYLDYSKETEVPLIDLLEENDSFTITISSHGCFHQTSEEVIIKRKRDTYTITWGELSKELTAGEIQLIRQFDLELRYMENDYSCTTTDTYVVQYKRMTRQIEDGSCSWNGAYYLKKQLFPNN